MPRHDREARVTAPWLVFARAAGNQLSLGEDYALTCAHIARALLAGVAAAEAVETQDALPAPGVDGCPEWARWLYYGPCGWAYWVGGETAPQDITSLPPHQHRKTWVECPPTYDNVARAGQCVRLKTDCGGTEGRAGAEPPQDACKQSDKGPQQAPAGIKPGPQSFCPHCGGGL